MIQHNFSIKHFSKALFLILTIFCAAFAHAQVFENPNFGISSHPTLNVTLIEKTEKGLYMQLVVENQLPEGWFCAEEEIFIRNSKGGIRYKLIQAVGIPICPERHKFKQLGESLQFELFFPDIEPEVRFIDLYEDCDNACFSIKGLVLDEKLNFELNLAYERFERGNHDLAILSFQEIIKDFSDYPFSLAYFNLINLYYLEGEIGQAKIWYQKFISANLLDKNEMLDILKQQDFYSIIIAE